MTKITPRVLVGMKTSSVYLKCETCGKEFRVFLSRLKQARTKGATTRYCSMKCYSKHGENNPFWGKRHSQNTLKKLSQNPNRSRFKAGPDNPNFVRFSENTFIGKTTPWWRAWFRKNIKKCEGCGYNKHPEILELHHLDSNPKNNVRKNLKWFCPNCHQWWHFEKQSGRYTGQQQ